MDVQNVCFIDEQRSYGLEQHEGEKLMFKFLGELSL